MKEEWKQVELDTRYEVSTYGRVRSNIRKGRILKQVNQNGYRAVTIKGKLIKIHRLVAMAFLDLTPSSPRNIVVMHLDDDKTNNLLSNLSVARQYENMSYRSKRGTLGVFYHEPSKMWRANWMKTIEYFNTEEEALEWRKNNID